MSEVRLPASIVLDRPAVGDRAGSRPPGRALLRLPDALAARTAGWPGPVRRLGPPAVILLAGTVLRVWQLGAVGFNSDEAVYAGQAAALAGDPAASQLFPIFRAHPLLFQTSLSLLYRLGAGDVAARALVAAFGVATIGVVWLLGRLLYRHRVGLIAALFFALMPYHVGVSRQVLLDAPMTFFATLTLYLFARFCVHRSPLALYAAALTMGLTVLAKETAVLLLGGLTVFAILCPAVRPRWRPAAVAVAITGLVVAAYPLSLQFSGRRSTGQNYLAWQLLRRANHTALFYLEVVPIAMGPGVVALALAGLWFLRRHGSWREALLLCWAGVPTVFFEVWPTKGYQYLLVTTPVVVILAARAVAALQVPRLRGPARAPATRLVRAGVVAVVAVSLAVPSWRQVDPEPTTTFLAGSGGLPAGREMGRWMARNLPEGARVMTIGPSMANIVRFYGNRPAVGLSVSPNPISRNPSYEPIDNPDRELRRGTIHYVVWDAYTAGRTAFFADRLLRYVEKYHGIVLHTESITVRSDDGSEVSKPVMIVYEVRP
ncbi:glycosyltransferase family 39 protein [Pseudonocardia acidicola]|uniref:Phospholipid carrier-dependent glycosyltransferase n=1 Tax=Pseudonocardia acidicola TaxID=2724939 RepID=A0ABX1SET4_9PSEU|nr:phospholipid carrier-dependent glycosyltransferase [Pseudonocardia acidicola]